MDSIKNDYRNELDNLIERWFNLLENEISYEELKAQERERIETYIGDIVEKYPELEELIPSPICWQ